MQMLVEGWVSQASARQRRGRAGRVRPGHCFRLFSRFMHDRRFQPFQLPEIKRVPLEGLCLQASAPITLAKPNHKTLPAARGSMVPSTGELFGHP
eukprot:1189210-Prorocentrum_minimum.AAC.3